MRRTVYECRRCPEPCRIVMLGEKLLHLLVCPGDGVDHAFWHLVSKCDVPDVEEEESKEVKDGE